MKLHFVYDERFDATIAQVSYQSLPIFCYRIHQISIPDSEEGTDIYSLSLSNVVDYSDSYSSVKMGLFVCAYINKQFPTEIECMEYAQKHFEELLQTWMR